jgi:signal transduction histidine kinase
LQQLRDDLTNTIVHDLRSPLTSILGSLYMLEEMVTPDKPDSDERQSVSISMRSAQRMLDLVNSLLDISKLKSGQALIEPKPVPLLNVVEAAVEHLSPLAEDSGIMIVHFVPSDLPLVLIDREKIHRVLINLIDNALKFTPQGGHVTILAERWRDDPAFVRCAVRDTGPGVPPEFRARIFERFVQIADQIGRRRGSGLGLSFCHLAVEAHGGQIWVDDAPGGGSEFSFTVKAAG